MTTAIYESRMALLHNMSILNALEDMVPADRLTFVSAISYIFCLSCGADASPDGVCGCLLDE